MIRPRPLSPVQEQEALTLLRETVKEWKVEILDDERIDGAEFLESMGPLLQLMAQEVED